MALAHLEHNPVSKTTAARHKHSWLERLYSVPLLAVAAVGVLAADYVIGPHIQFPFLFIAPVAAAAWFHGRNWGVVFATALPIAHLGITIANGAEWSVIDVEINALIRLVVLVLFAVLIDQAAQRHRLAAEVKALRGLLPICSFCKQIRRPDGTWEVLEKYIEERTDAEFSHGLCDACARKHYGAYLK